MGTQWDAQWDHRDSGRGKAASPDALAHRVDQSAPRSVLLAHIEQLERQLGDARTERDAAETDAFALAAQLAGFRALYEMACEQRDAAEAVINAPRGELSSRLRAYYYLIGAPE